MLEVDLGGRVWDRVEIFGLIGFFGVFLKRLRQREDRDKEKDGM